ncbi:protein NSP-INTERACTING KINASE 1-like isoform X2 [Macadamia integrifolia]|uniref:protein NSP-INTERACTING KINASE 1-like isoform X2 n=1 Tax=Macadamia integrifolia TaxID=60698 RepID=UPI001C4EA8F6|nr:protein NSP-INTERACTING KINASE 1-like isoform X2 [Macadamia integrifolia]
MVSLFLYSNQDYYKRMMLLQDNNISEPTPVKLGRLLQLQTLDLSNNFFTGEVPSSLGRLQKLQYLQEVMYQRLVKLVLLDPFRAGHVFDFLLPHFHCLENVL